MLRRILAEDLRLVTTLATPGDLGDLDEFII